MRDFWQGENIRLRSVEAEDWEVIYNWSHDTEKLKRLDRIQFPPSKSGTKKWIEKKVEKNGKDDEFAWIVEDGKGNPVGLASTFFVDSGQGHSIMPSPSILNTGDLDLPARRWA